MSAPERISIVLRAATGQSLEPVLPFVQIGAMVAIGRGLAEIAGDSDRDVVTPALEREEFDVDAHVRMALNARRYLWLRDVAFDTPRQDLALRDRHQNLLIEGDLDAEIDRAMRAYPGDETTQNPGSLTAEKPAVDLRDLFIKANPIGASPGELEKSRNGFVDDRTHGDYLIFRAGYEAGQGGGQ